MISGDKIKKRREQMGLKRNALAALVGVSRNTIYNWESGGNQPDKYRQQLLTTALQCDISDISYGEGEPFPDAGQKGKEVSVTSAHPVTAKDAPLSSTVPATPFTNEFRISEALQMTARVLESGTSYATALYLNIQHFDRAITA